MKRSSFYPPTHPLVRKDFWMSILCAFSYINLPARLHGSSIGGADYEPMERQGILIRDTPQKTDWCDRCCCESKAEPHRSINGKIHYWRTCCFPIKRVNPKNFRVWLVEPQPMIDLFRERVGIKGSITEVTANQIWKWGRRGQQSFVYIRHVSQDDLKSVAAVLKQFPKSLFITPRMVYLETLDIALPNRGIAWDDVSSLSENYSIQLDLEKIEAILVPPEPVRRSCAKSRLEKIDRLVTVMKDHYLLAKSHYLATKGEILRRPTQVELAERAETTPVVVTRCLRDKKAVLLKTLWENAENSAAIIR